MIDLVLVVRAHHKTCVIIDGTIGKSVENSHCGDPCFVVDKLLWHNRSIMSTPFFDNLYIFCYDWSINQKGGNVKKKKNKVGRPPLYNDEIANVIFTRLSKGEALVDICDDADMPSAVTVWRWTQAHQDFGKMYERAKELCGEYYSALVLGVARDDNRTVPNRRLEIDALKWTSGRLRTVRKDKEECPEAEELSVDDKKELFERLRAELSELGQDD